MGADEEHSEPDLDAAFGAMALAKPADDDDLFGDDESDAGAAADQLGQPVAENRLDVPAWGFHPAFEWFRTEFTAREEVTEAVAAALDRDPAVLLAHPQVPLAGYVRKDGVAADAGATASAVPLPVDGADDGADSDSGEEEAAVGLPQRYRDVRGLRPLNGQTLLARVAPEGPAATVRVRRVPFTLTRRAEFRAAVLESATPAADLLLARYYNLPLLALASPAQLDRRLRATAGGPRYPDWLRTAAEQFPRGAAAAAALPDLPNVRIGVVDQPGHALHGRVVPVGSVLWAEHVGRVPELGQIFLLQEFGLKRATWFRPGSPACHRTLVHYLRGAFDGVTADSTAKFKRLLYALQAAGGKAHDVEAFVDRARPRPTVASLQRQDGFNPLPYRRLLRNRLKGLVGRARSVANHPWWYSEDPVVQAALRLLPERAGAVLAEAAWVARRREKGSALRKVVAARIGPQAGRDPPAAYLEGSRGAAQRAGQVSYTRTEIDGAGRAVAVTHIFDGGRGDCTLDRFNAATGYSLPYLARRSAFKPSIGRTVHSCARVAWSQVKRDLPRYQEPYDAENNPRGGALVLAEAFPDEGEYAAYDRQRWHRTPAAPGGEQSGPYQALLRRGAVAQDVVGVTVAQRAAQRKRALADWRRLVESRDGVAPAAEVEDAEP